MRFADNTHVEFEHVNLVGRRIGPHGYRIGDYVLVHVGFAISQIDEKAAHETLAALKEMGELAELGAPPDTSAAPAADGSKKKNAAR